MKVIIAFAFLAVVAYAEHAPVYHAPVVHSAPHHGGGYHEPQYKSEPPKYEFEYGVQDDKYYNNYGHREHRDGYSTEGEYHVQLPDGRTQYVSYHVADDYSGYVADVRYEGSAKHPEPVYHKPTYHEPVYHSAPVHH